MSLSKRFPLFSLLLGALLVAFAGPVLTAAEPPVWRTWTHADGDFTLRAKLVSAGGDSVVLSTDAGKTLELPLEKLSPADRKYVAENAKQKSQKLPQPPLKLAPPATPSARVHGYDQRHYSVDELNDFAWSDYEEGKYDDAAKAAHWSVVRTTHGGRYDLACFYAVARDTDAALYWLQRAALEESLDPVYVEANRDLEPIRRDPRWKQVASFLEQARQYWAESGIVRTKVVTPRDYKAGSPIPLIVDLHANDVGLDDFPIEEYQALADELGVAFVGMTALIPTSPHTFRWSDDKEKNTEHVLKALASLGDRVKAAPGQRVVIGFLEGGEVAAHLAAGRPEEYAGALLMTPLGVSNGFPGIESKPEHKTQHHVLRISSEEFPDDVDHVKQLDTAFKKLGSGSDFEVYQSETSDIVPADFWTKLPEWIEAAVKPRTAE